MEKLRKIFSTVLSLAFILAFLYFVGIRAYDTAKNLPDEVVFSYYENRNLRTEPELTKTGVLDGSYFSDVDAYLRDHTSDRDEVLEIDTKINMNVLRRPVVNETVIGDGILLPYNEYETVDPSAIDAEAEVVAANLLAHTKQTESYGGRFYYVAVPCQYAFYEDRYPSYLNNREEYTDASTEALFGKLDRDGVSYIDMGEIFDKLGNRPEFSSDVDNHYGIIGAYETYRAILSRINSDTELGLDVLDEDEYILEELPNRYLGSRLRKLFGIWEKEEHLFKMTPSENIPYRRWDNGVEKDPQLYYHSWDPSADVLYYMYMGGDVMNTVIDTERDHLPDILVYGDSFTNAVECVMWYSFDRMESIDFRHYGDMTLEEYIDKNKPDIVVCIRDYEALLVSEMNGQ